MDMNGLNRLCSWRAQGHPEAWRQDREKYKDLDRHSNSGADGTPFANLTVQRFAGQNETELSSFFLCTAVTFVKLEEQLLVEEQIYGF